MTSHQYSFASNQQPCEISFANPHHIEPAPPEPMHKPDPLLNLKSTEQLVLEKADHEKKILMKQKLKQQRLYKKII